MVAEKQAHAAVRCVLDREGRFTAVAPWLCQATGWSSEALISRPMVDWLHPEDRDDVMAELGMLSPAAGAVPIEGRFRQASGAYRWLTWIVWLDAGTVQARVWDAAASMAAQERAEDVSRCYGWSWIALRHDWYASLTFMVGTTEFLAEQSELDAETRRMLEHVAQAALTMHGMSRQLNDVFMALGESCADENFSSLQPLLDGVVAETRAWYGEQHIELEYQPANELPALLLAREHSLRAASKYLLRTCPVLGPPLSYWSISPRLLSRASIERVVFDVGLQDGRLVLRATASGCAGPVPDIPSFDPDIVFEAILRQLGTKLHIEPRADGWSLWFSIEYVPTRPAPP
jgi:PAS domain S-box-containing protein